MPVPTSIDDLSTTAGSNSPSGSEGPGDGDNYIRAHGAFIATLRDKLNSTSNTGTVKNATFSGTMAGAVSWSGLQTFAAGIETTAPNGKVYGETYTPTFTLVANVSTVLDSSDCVYTRNGSVVTVYGQITVSPTVSATLTQIGVSLPVASSFTTLKNLTGVCSVASDLAGSIVADSTNDRAEIRFIAPSTSSQFITYHFSYVVI